MGFENAEPEFALLARSVGGSVSGKGLGTTGSDKLAYGSRYPFGS